VLLKRIADRNIWVIYATIVLLGIAYGTSIAVLGVHLDAHGIPKLAIGGLAAAFALGIITFSIPAGSVVQRFGAKTTLAVALAGYAVCVTSFPFLSTLVGLSIARFFDGAFSVFIWVAAETALLSRSDRSNKGLVMSLYAISLALGYVVGPLLASVVVRFGGTGGTFVVAGALACVAIAVVLVGLDRQGASVAVHEDAAATGGESGEAASSFTIFWRTKTSCFATFSYGYFQASVVPFLPLYLIASKNVPAERTILVTAFFAAGMLLTSTWAGGLGDRHGHLLVMRILATVGGTMVASFVLLPSFPLMCAAVFMAGATLASISPVSLALQGVVTPKAELGRANAFYNAAYAAGMLVGPTVSGLLFTRYGGAAMLFHLAALWAGFVVLTVVFAADDPRHARHATRQGAGGARGQPPRSGRTLRAMLR
jgi:MFS family permease